jgi:threonine aldolase
VKQAVPVREIAQHFDTLSVCLSKGLGAPVGSVLCGRADLISKARRWRKMLGGGMRQAGVLAAAGIYALTSNVERLADDHDNALALAQGLAGIDGVSVAPAAVQTNMVFMTVPAERADALRAFLRQRNVLLGGGHHIRLVTHLDVTAADVQEVVRAVEEFFATAGRRLIPQPN